MYITKNSFFSGKCYLKSGHVLNAYKLLSILTTLKYSCRLQNLSLIPTLLIKNGCQERKIRIKTAIFVQNDALVQLLLKH